MTKCETPNSNADSFKHRSSPRCATPAISSILNDWKVEPCPYDNPAYDQPTCQREKIIPSEPPKQIRCATPFIDQVLKEETEYEHLIATSLTPDEALEVLEGRRGK